MQRWLRDTNMRVYIQILRAYVKLGIVACVYNPSAPAGKWELENMDLPQKPTGQTALQMPQLNRTCLKQRKMRLFFFFFF